jgi:sugar phosphate isomerase/epimerase
MSLPIALQLYTVREPLAENTDAGLAQVASIGYKYVELAGLYGKSSEQFKTLLDKHRLTAISAHEPIHCLLNDPTDVIARARLFGYKFVVCPYLEESQRNDYAKIAGQLGEVGRKLAAAGLTLCYHNHDFEWKKDADGQRGIDLLFRANGGQPLGCELDVYWVAKAGDDPVEWMRKLTGRLPLLHLKDMADTPDKGFAEVGTGVINFKTILSAAGACGVRYLIIEQDANWKDSPMESARVGLENLRSMVG